MTKTLPATVDCDFGIQSSFMTRSILGHGSNPAHEDAKRTAGATQSAEVFATIIRSVST
jgi:hypothetical protein